MGKAERERELAERLADARAIGLREAAAVAAEAGREDLDVKLIKAMARLLEVERVQAAVAADQYPPEPLPDATEYKELAAELAAELRAPARHPKRRKLAG